MPEPGKAHRRESFGLAVDRSCVPGRPQLSAYSWTRFERHVVMNVPRAFGQRFGERKRPPLPNEGLLPGDPSGGDSGSRPRAGAVLRVDAAMSGGRRRRAWIVIHRRTSRGSSEMASGLKPRGRCRGSDMVEGLDGTPRVGSSLGERKRAGSSPRWGSCASGSPVQLSVWWVMAGADSRSLRAAARYGSHSASPPLERRPRPRGCAGRTSRREPCVGHQERAAGPVPCPENVGRSRRRAAHSRGVVNPGRRRRGWWGSPGRRRVR